MTMSAAMSSSNHFMKLTVASTTKLGRITYLQVKFSKPVVARTEHGFRSEAWCIKGFGGIAPSAKNQPSLSYTSQWQGRMQTFTTLHANSSPRSQEKSEPSPCKEFPTVKSPPSKRLQASRNPCTPATLHVNL